MPFSASGYSGELRAGGRVAARLGAWDARRDVDGWVGHAVLLETTPVYGMADRYEMRLTFGDGFWRWRGIAAAGEGSIRFVTDVNPERVRNT